MVKLTEVCRSRRMLIRRLVFVVATALLILVQPVSCQIFNRTPHFIPGSGDMSRFSLPENTPVGSVVYQLRGRSIAYQKLEKSLFFSRNTLITSRQADPELTSHLPYAVCSGSLARLHRQQTTERGITLFIHGIFFPSPKLRFFNFCFPHWLYSTCPFEGVVSSLPAPPPLV